MTGIEARPQVKNNDVGNGLVDTKIAVTRETNPEIVISNSNLTNSTVSKQDIANEENFGRKLFLATVNAEQKVKFLRQLRVCVCGGGG